MSQFPFQSRTLAKSPEQRSSNVISPHRLAISFDLISSSPHSPKIHLDPQQSGSVTLKMDRGCFSFWNPDEDHWEVAKGKYILRIGNSSASLPLLVDLEIGDAFTWRGL